MGALRFKTDKEGPFILDDDPVHPTPPMTSLRELERAINELEQDASLDHKEYLKRLSFLIAPRSSLGGARPKASLRSEDDHYRLQNLPVKMMNSGSLRGRVIDGDTNEPLVGATIYIEELEIGSAANVSGGFEIDNIPAGEYTLQITSIGYQPKTHLKIIYKSGIKRYRMIGKPGVVSTGNSVCVLKLVTFASFTFFYI